MYLPCRLIARHRNQPAPRPETKRSLTNLACLESSGWSSAKSQARAYAQYRSAVLLAIPSVVAASSAVRPAKNRIFTDRHGPKPPHNHPLPPNVLRAAGGTAAGLHSALDRKDHTPSDILRSHVTVVTNPKSMVQQARGHIGISCLKSLVRNKPTAYGRATLVAKD